MKYNNKKASNLQEKQVAKHLGGYVTPGSGGTSHGGGDVFKDNWFIECKTVTSEKNSYSIKKSVIDKMTEQCFEQKKEYCALAFRFSPNSKDYYTIDEDTFRYMMKCTNFCDKNNIDVGD